MYTQDRKTDFDRIVQELSGESSFLLNDSLSIQGSALDVLRKIPSDTISLILTDPPYHSTKKKNIHGDTFFKTDSEFVDWIEELSIEWHRILRPNGCLYMYCSSKMAAHLEVMLCTNFNILSSIVWTKPNEPGFDGWKQKMKKEALRQWYPHSERIIFAEPAIDGNLHRSHFADFLRRTRKLAGMSGHELTELTGAYGKVNHGGAVSNWETGRNIPSREQYAKICEALMSTGIVDFMPQYENVIRAFSVTGDIEFTDVWDFFSVRPYKGKHPAEKPLDMLTHIVTSSSFEHDIILDCFAGSGSSAIAALANGRKAITIEIVEEHCVTIRERIKYFYEEEDFCMKGSIKKKRRKSAEKISPSQLSLLS